jgi:hypothetical protein
VVDGNFSAEHMKMSRAENNVRLMNGHGYMVEDGRYQDHLNKSIKVKEVSFPISIHGVLAKSCVRNPTAATTRLLVKPIPKLQT